MPRQVNRKKPTDLDGTRWLRYSISIWDNIKKTKEEVAIKHPAMFPTRLVRRLLKVYAKSGDIVLDPFLGSGSTLVAAKSLGIHGIGFDINPDYLNMAKRRLTQSQIPLPPQKTLKKSDHDRIFPEKMPPVESSPEPRLQFDIHLDTAENLLNYLKPESVDICITSPPYWDIHWQKRTADLKESRPYSELEHDLGNIAYYDLFLHRLQSIFTNIYKVLKKGARCVIICMDIRKKANFYPLHIDLTEKMKEIGFDLEDIIIWDRRKEYSNLRPLGYPYVFRVNKIHEFLMIYLKPTG
ncbi:MAG: DNA methyltransferase [Candidatus Heimdallarchaeota archaeon]